MKLKSLLLFFLLFISLSASTQTAIELNEKADEYYNLGDFAKAVEYYQKAAEQGLADAQYDLGVFYEYGYGVAQNYSEAMKWYQKAAEQGYAKAIDALK